MRSPMAGLRVALVQDWLMAYTGGERVLEQTLKVFPQADVYTLVDFLEPEDRRFLEGRPTHRSFLQRMPFARKHYRRYLPLMPFAIERFDRAPGGERIHIEDFAQVFGLFPDKKYKRRNYANIAAVLWAETSEEDTYAFVRRLVFSTLIGNGDMHLKNWSLGYPDGRIPVLAPAYDLVSTIPYIGGDRLALTFGKSRSLTEITREQVRRFADKARLPSSPLWDIVSETAERTVEAWRVLEARDVLPSPMRATIQKQIETAARSIR